MYAPKINPNQGMYLYQIYPGTKKTAPIIIWGNLIPRPVKFENRLHLKLIQPSEFITKFKKDINFNTSTRKYDGASCYFHSKPGPGIKLFSPRISKLTNYQIEYTYKACEIADQGSVHQPIGMGEILFWKYTPIGKYFNLIFNTKLPEYIGWNYLKAAEIGGILNSNSVRNRNHNVELRMYRIDEYDNIKTFNLEYNTNRALQRKIEKELNNPWIKTVSKEKAKINRTTSKWEGFVGVPNNLSINEGYKIKWVSNPDDWQITSIDLKPGNKGGIAGVVWFKSLESGKQFKLGTGSLGPIDRSLDMINDPNKYIGRVAKVISRLGHEGRAAKFAEWHDGKGLW